MKSIKNNQRVRARSNPSAHRPSAFLCWRQSSVRQIQKWRFNRKSHSVSFVTRRVMVKRRHVIKKSWRVLPVNRHEISFQSRRNIVPGPPERRSKAAGTLFQSRRNVCPRPWDDRGILCLFKNSASYGNTQAQSPALDLRSLATEGTPWQGLRYATCLWSFQAFDLTCGSWIPYFRNEVTPAENRKMLP